ncbi:hypothetical protein [Acinetobacter bereziniae]|nr:hypothetical protein [uncultured Acinetobacter sp.]
MSINLDQYLEQALPLSSVFKFVGAQWSIYTMILAYKWSEYGIKKVKL